MENQDPNRHVFSIATMTNPKTKRPFGDRYAGEFIVRRPTLQDKRDIGVRDIATSSAFGTIDPKHLSTNISNINYIFSFFAVIGEKIPAWFDIGALYEEDWDAVDAAWKELSRWLGTFRSGRGDTQG